MGITINSKHDYLNTGFGGFRKLRMFVSVCMDSYYHCNGDLETHYRGPDSGLFVDDAEAFWEAYDAETLKIQKKYKIPQYALTFLYQPDTEGRLTVKGTRALYDIIKDKDTIWQFGYDVYPWTFQEFKHLVKDCKDSHTGLHWY